MSQCKACGAMARPFREVSGYAYFECEGCGLIQIDPKTIDRIDNGEPVIAYADGYWQNEMATARERAYGVALARAAEVFLLARRPIDRFLDIGTGSGTFLDAIARFLPDISDRFHGVELFPPPEADRTPQKNYRVGHARDYPAAFFDGGMCIEVFEHLTPCMVDGILAAIGTISRDGACYLINTGLAAFTREEEPGYLDPTGRGHITSWTVAAINHLARPYGLVASPMPGRSYCFLLEKRPVAGSQNVESIEDRMATPVRRNVMALQVPGVGASPVALLGEVGLRESYYQQQFLDRTRWAIALDAQVKSITSERRGRGTGWALAESGSLMSGSPVSVSAAALRAELAVMQESRSWRLTAPLRRLAVLLGRGRRGG